jgi:chemotaxis protein MotB
MKKSLYLVMAIVIPFVYLFSSCGPNKKLMDSEARVNQLQKESVVVQSELNDCKIMSFKLRQEKESLQEEISVVQDDLNALNFESEMTISEQSKRLLNLQNLIHWQKDLLNNLKNSISDALINYKTDELYIYVKDGKVFVTLEEKLLFKSGSDVVDPAGKKALKSLAVVLNKTKDIYVVIEGHTDNVPIKNSHYKDNWDLSAARATSIVRILTKEFGVDPGTISASGKGKYNPINTNDSEKGRSGNRRTEIILSPDLSEIYSLLSI